MIIIRSALILGHFSRVFKSYRKSMLQDATTGAGASEVSTLDWTRAAYFRFRTLSELQTACSVFCEFM